MHEDEATNGAGYTHHSRREPLLFHFIAFSFFSFLKKIHVHFIRHGLNCEARLLTPRVRKLVPIHHGVALSVPHLLLNKLNSLFSPPFGDMQGAEQNRNSGVLDELFFLFCSQLQIEALAMCRHDNHKEAVKNSYFFLFVCLAYSTSTGRKWERWEKSMHLRRGRIESVKRDYLDTWQEQPCFDRSLGQLASNHTCQRHSMLDAPLCDMTTFPRPSPSPHLSFSQGQWVEKAVEALLTKCAHDPNFAVCSVGRVSHFLWWSAPPKNWWRFGGQPFFLDCATRAVQVLKPRPCYWLRVMLWLSLNYTRNTK